MTEEEEVIIFLFATGVLLFVLVKHSQLGQLPAGAMLLAGFISFWFGWGFTVVEGLCWPTFFNYLEHISYLVGSLLIASWSWLAFGKRTRSS